jgi:hypothetical protein
MKDGLTILVCCGFMAIRVALDNAVTLESESRVAAGSLCVLARVFVWV